MRRDLVLPVDFSAYAWEVEAKGVFWDATVRIDERIDIEVTFYDPVRLMQDVTSDLKQRPAFVLRRAIVVQAVTEQNMRDAIERAPAHFFE